MLGAFVKNKLLNSQKKKQQQQQHEAKFPNFFQT